MSAKTCADHLAFSGGVLPSPMAIAGVHGVLELLHCNNDSPRKLKYLIQGPIADFGEC